MIKHYVLFKLEDNSDQKLEKAKEILMSMKGNFKKVKDIFVGCDFLKSERSFDISLEVILENKDELDAYQNDPYHVNVVKKYMHSVAIKSVALDCML